MTADKIIRKQHTGQAGNGGEFGNHNRPDSDVVLNPAAPVDHVYLSQLRGNTHAVDTMLVAAAGGHNMILNIDHDAEDESDAIVAGLGRATGQHVVTVPDGATASDFIGRGDEPGFLARANGGILYIPGALAQSPAALDTLRQPLATSTLRVQRGAVILDSEADFQLVLGVTTAPRGTSAHAARRHASKLSGPLRDHIGLVTTVVTSVDSAPATLVTEAEARETTVAAQNRIKAMLSGTPWKRISQVPGSWFRAPERRLSRDATAPLDRALERGAITLRGYDRALRLAYTNATMNETEVNRSDVVWALEQR